MGDNPSVSANLDLVRSIYAAWERENYGPVEWADPEIDFARPDRPEPGRWIGLARMAEHCREFLGTWQDFRAAAESYREPDGRHVLVLGHMGGRRKESAESRRTR